MNAPKRGAPKRGPALRGLVPVPSNLSASAATRYIVGRYMLELSAIGIRNVTGIRTSIVQKIVNSGSCVSHLPAPILARLFARVFVRGTRVSPRFIPRYHRFQSTSSSFSPSFFLYLLHLSPSLFASSLSYRFFHHFFSYRDTVNQLFGGLWRAPTYRVYTHARRACAPAYTYHRVKENPVVASQPIDRSNIRRAMLLA